MNDIVRYTNKFRSYIFQNKCKSNQATMSFTAKNTNTTKYKYNYTSENFYQVARPLTMKKDGIQTRNRKLSAKVFIHKNTREQNLHQYENVYSFFTQKVI